MLLVKVDSDVKFLLAEGIVIIEEDLGDDVILECAAPILRNIITCDICMPKITLSNKEFDTEYLDAKWLLECIIEVNIVLFKLFIIINKQYAYLYLSA